MIKRNYFISCIGVNDENITYYGWRTFNTKSWFTKPSSTIIEDLEKEFKESCEDKDTTIHITAFNRI